jgi:hypothetical protein
MPGSRRFLFSRNLSFSSLACFRCSLRRGCICMGSHLYIIHTFLYHLRFAFSTELLFVCTNTTEAEVQQPMLYD